MRGYYFDALIRGDKTGIKETYKRVGRGRVEVVLGLTITGKVPRAVTYYKSAGFIDLRDVVEDEEDLENFFRANHPTYGVVGSIGLIGRVIKSDDFLEVMEFYVPIAENADNTVSCDMLDVKKGYHKRLVSQDVYNGLVENLTKCFENIPLDTKEDYIRARL